MKITLDTWAARNFDPPPTLPTLRTWARSGHIQPAPVKVGRTWYVDADAAYTAGAHGNVDASGLSERAAGILRKAA